MIDINWNIFKSKFNEKESVVFERLAYMLFCYEFNIRVGIFRFKNQTGIETEPIDVDGLKVAFQAKYYDTKLAVNKDDIIDSLKKAKSKNAELDKILVYTNQELSETIKKDKKKPAYQIEIEQAALKIDLIVEWRVLSHFEKQLSVPENEYLAQYFFGQGDGIVDFLNKIEAHSTNILFAIQTDIQFRKQQIKIDRSNDLSKLESDKAQILILAGEGGSGKTALVKELFNSQDAPCYVLKAAEFTKADTTAVFSQFGNYDLNDFLLGNKDEARKTFIIDSAEKLADLKSQDVFIELLSALIKDHWKIIFTTRNSYLDDLCFQMLEVYRLPFDVIKLESLSATTLENLSATFQFNLPNNPRLQTLIGNLFYLNEFLANYDIVNEHTDIERFRDILWQKKIQNARFKKDNIHLERGRCFLQLAKHRCDTGNFFLSGEPCKNEILSLLEADEIIKYEPYLDGNFITHDIYEEWALEKLIEKEYADSLSHSSFFENIGNSLPIRRAFREWLSDKLQQVDPDIQLFIEQSFNMDVIPVFWKDELLISVLLSDYSAVFFQLLDSVLLVEDKVLLKKIIFLLRTACKELDPQLNKIFQHSKDITVSPAYVFTKPKGRGWEAAIEYLYTKIDFVQKDELDYILPLLKDWIGHRPTGNTAKQAGRFALHFYKDAELNGDVYYGSEVEEKLLKILLAATFELKDELIAITEDLLSKPFNRQAPFDSLREAVLASGYDNSAYVMNLPKYVIRLADTAWHNDKTVKAPFYSPGFGVEGYYSLHDHSEYFPPSALQTPVYLLLFANFSKTIDFIIHFTNRAVESYLASGFDAAVHEIEVSIGADKKKQIISSSLWNIYRGSGSPVTPYLLQSIHMALEKRLLEVGKLDDKEILRGWLVYLLKNTKSASITAVVTSLVLAYPDDLFEVATMLFKNYEFYKYDNLRAGSELEARSLYLIGSGLDSKQQYKNERIATCDDPHRKLSLEGLALNYQWFKNEHITQEEADKRQEKIWEIIDHFYSTIPATEAETENNKKMRLLLARIDRRKMNPIVHQQGDGVMIEFNPSLESDLKKYSEEGMQAYEERFKYTGLKAWATGKIEKNRSRGNYPQYDENPALVLAETKAILDAFQEVGNQEFYLFNGAVPAYTCAALLQLYSDKLSADDKLFCKDIVLDYATDPLKEHYGYQIGDGVEAAISTLPFLYRLFPEERETFNIILLFTLLDTYPLGEYKRICDYAIEAIRDRLFELSTDDANSVLLGYMMFKPQFDQDNSRQKQIRERKTRAVILDEFATKYDEELQAIAPTAAYYNEIDFVSQGIQIAETVFQIIPSDTSDPVHLDYIKKLLEKFAGKLLAPPRYSNKEPEDDHRLKHRFYKKYASFLLHREVATIKDWVKPFTTAFTISSGMANFLSDVVSEEDSLGKYDSFWEVWECFYPAIRTAAKKSKSQDMDEIIRNYLLAWPYWRDTAKEWKSLRERETVFFQRICSEMSDNPSVLYAIAKLLNEIGSSFLDKGISWIAGMLSKSASLQTGEVHPNTIYYLEIIVRKYVYLNRTKLKTNRLVKGQIIGLLNFLVARGSVNGYLLREDIL